MSIELVVHITNVFFVWNFEHRSYDLCFFVCSSIIAKAYKGA